MQQSFYLSTSKGLVLTEMLADLQHRIMAVFSIALSLSLIVLQLACWWLNIPVYWYGLVACQIIFLLFYGHYFITRQKCVLRYAQLTFLLLTPLIVQLCVESGSGSGIVYWAFLAPVAAFVAAIGKKNSALWWCLGYFVVLVLAFSLDIFWGRTFDSSVHVVTALFLPVNMLVLMAILITALFFYARHRGDIDLIRKNQYALLRKKHTSVIDRFEGNSALLNNILPDRIVRRLLNNSEIIADGHSDVSVIFIDMVGFTHLSESMSPKQIVILLNQVFSGFDEIIERYGLEKIKTIGDAYMVAGGLVKKEAGSDYVLDVIAAAQACQKFIKDNNTFPEFKRLNLATHIGIATGPVAAGVIGTSRLAYDIWGGTVNRASQLVDVAGKNEIFVDQSSYWRVKWQFQFDEARKIELKGVQEIDIYRLVGKKEPAE